MRLRSRGRHQRPARASARTYAVTLIAALAVLSAALTATGTFASASVTVPAVTLAGRGAEAPAAPELNPGQVRAEIAQIAVQARIRAAAQAAATLAARTYTVRPGDSISAVAVRKCARQARMWTGIYAASRARGWTAWNASSLAAGQHLYLSCAYLPAMLRFAPPPPPPAPVRAIAAVATARTVSTATQNLTYGHPDFCGDGDGDGWDVNCQAPAASPAGRTARALRAAVQAPVQAATVSTAGLGSYQSCVITRESGGQTQVMNSSGHYGLYQFDYGTWVSGGGAGPDFGHASAAEQNRVFAAVYAARGTQPWSPSDGC